MPENKLDKLIAKVFYEIGIEALTGLHIGAGDTSPTIGGADKLVVRNPSNNRPYIPGSSIKGKMRSLLERSGEGGAKLEMDGKGGVGPCKCGKCKICIVFGVPADQKKAKETGKAIGSARLIVRDAHLLDDSAIEMDKWRSLEFPYAEVKTEVSIDRLTSAANPRNFERVPAGARFSLQMILNVFEEDAEQEHKDLIKTGLRLIASDYIGGQGSRGYGAVDICINKISKVSIDAIAERGLKFEEEFAKNELSNPEHMVPRLAKIVEA